MCSQNWISSQVLVVFVGCRYVVGTKRIAVQEKLYGRRCTVHSKFTGAADVALASACEHRQVSCPSTPLLYYNPCPSLSALLR